MVKRLIEPVVLFGGSFDPVHRGHLEAAREAAEQLSTRDIRLIPCHIPPHKDALKTKPSERVAMLELALADYPGFSIDRWELEQSKPSYTVDTLRRYREEIGAERGLVFLMGWDSLQTLPSWYDWQALAALTHFAVWRRPGYSALPKDVEHWLQGRRCSAEQLAAKPCGGVALLQTTPCDVSATQLRALSATGVSSPLLPEAVEQYIRQHKLYQNG